MSLWRFESAARACLLLGLIGFVTTTGARPPDWLTPLVAEDVSVLGRGKIAVRLLESGDVRHLPDNRVKRVQRGAIRILTDLGRQRASCAYQFNADTERVTAARAWVVFPDGKKSQEFGIRAFTDAARKIGNIFWPQQRSLSYRATSEIPIGSVFAWEFEVESQTGISDINWVFPTDLSTVWSVLEVTPSPGGRLEWNGVLEPKPGASPGALRWEKRNTLSTPAGERLDGFLADIPMLSVRNVPANGAAAIQSWSQLAQLAAGIIEPRMVASSELKAKAESLVAGRTGRWDRARALSEFVQKEISYLALVLDQDYLAGYRPHAAGEVLQNRYGDCKDKAALFVTMLRAIGDAGHVVMVAAGNPKAVDPKWPSARFNHAIAALPADEAVPAHWPVVDAGPLGRIVLFDPTDPNTPLGLLSTADQGGFGLVASEKSAGLISLPIAPAESNRIEMRIRATLDEAGTLTSNIEEVATGNIGVMFRTTRESHRNERFTPLLETRLRETMPVVEDLQWKDSWQAADACWRLDFACKTPRYARRTGGDLMLVSPQVILGRVRLAPWNVKQAGVVWSAASVQRKNVRLTLPAQAKIEEMPDDWTNSISSATCRLSYRREANDVIYDFELTQKGGFLDQSSYEALRRFLQKVYDAERRPVLLRRPPRDDGAK